MKILLSELGRTTREDFEMCVQVHAADLRAHDAHMQKVANGVDDHVAYPPPVALQIVDQCIRRPDLVPDYEIVDDSPTPAERLRAARHERRGELATLEANARAAVVPHGKLRARSIREADVRALPEKKRSRVDAAFLREQEDIAAKFEAIHRHGAKLEAEIEDLDEEALKSWRPVPFPG